MNCKGSITDIPFVIVVGAILLALTSVIAGGVLHNLVDAFEDDSTMNADNLTSDNIVPIKSRFFSLVDWIFVFGFFASWVLIYIILFYNPADPVFMIAGTLVYIISIFLSAVFSNLFVDSINGMASSLLGGVSGSIESNIPLIIFITSNLPMIVTLFGMIAIIIMYSNMKRLG